MAVEMVTRTVKGTLLTILCANTESGECVHEEYLIKGTVKDEKKMMKYLRKKFEDTELVPVQIVKQECVIKRYGMTEDEFISNAKEMALLKRNEEN